MFERLRSLFGRKKAPVVIDSPLARYAGGNAATGPGPRKSSVPPPPPLARDPEPAAIEPVPERKGRVRVILDDGTLAPLPDDPDIRDQMERLANQILPTREDG